MQRILRGLVVALSLAAARLPAQDPAPSNEAPLALPELPALVFGHDTSAAISAQTTLFALHSYQGMIATAMPQVDFSTNYSLAYIPSQESESTTFTTSFPYVQTADLKVTDQGTDLLSAKLSLSQLLPTAGNLFLALENTTAVSTVGSQTLAGVTTNPSAQFTQKPKLTIGLTQPMFLNGKIIDLGLLPATLRKAQLGYEEQDLADLAQRNQAIGQAVQLYFSIVQLRKSLAQTRKSIEVTQGNLDAMQKSYSMGSVAEPDLLDAKLALSRQKQGLLELSSTLTKTERLLAHSIGRDSLDGLPLTEEVPALPFTLTRQEIIDKALAGHPLVRQKGLASEEKRVDEVLAGQQFASSLTLSFSWSPRYPYDPNNNPYTSTDLGASFTDLFKDGSGQDYALSAGLTIHLFDGGQQAESLAGKAALSAAAEQGLRAQREAILDQVDLDLMQQASSKENIALLQEAAGLAERRLATEKNLLALGKSTDLDVAAKAADAEAKANDLWRAQADLYLTILDLYSLAGEDLAGIVEGKTE